MAIMEHRTTFALDEATIHRLKKLAAMWRVSQSEVVRRSLERAEADAEEAAESRIARLEAYHARGGVAADTASSYLSEVARDRSDWGRGQ